MTKLADKAADPAAAPAAPPAPEVNQQATPTALLQEAIADPASVSRSPDAADALRAAVRQYDQGIEADRAAQAQATRQELRRSLGDTMAPFVGAPVHVVSQDGSCDVRGQKHFAAIITRVREDGSVDLIHFPPLRAPTPIDKVTHASVAKKDQAWCWRWIEPEAEKPLDETAETPQP